MEDTAQKLYSDAFYGEYQGTRKHTKRKKDGTTGTPASEKPPRRGPHRAENAGMSMGGGQDEPTQFYHDAPVNIILANLVSQLPIQFLAGFINGMFLSFGAVLHEFYRSTMEQLHTWNPDLPRLFSETVSVFAAATFNFGPRTVTFPHLDYANLAWGWCSITALGNFDPNKGGHLILWDLRLVIRFPPGSSILIPSAILRHSNVSIQQDETRFSFTQYTAAGIFRFVYSGFRTEKSLKRSRMSKAARARRMEDRRNRWSEGMQMYTKFDVAFD
ncbi:hypothetical protein FB451DRAFT_1062275 [Mycena latifolia]|nr:hypothetical protein FB451DRAFT_1062275 [Mycena latifolia]